MDGLPRNPETHATLIGSQYDLSIQSGGNETHQAGTDSNDKEANNRQSYLSPRIAILSPIQEQPEYATYAIWLSRQSKPVTIF